MRYGKAIPRQSVATNADLHEWLGKHNWSNREGAKRLGMSEQTIYNWLAGRYPRNLWERMAAVDQGETPSKSLPERWYWRNSKVGLIRVRWTLERCLAERDEVRRSWEGYDLIEFDRNHARDGELISG